MVLLPRSKEAAQLKEWEKSEDQFHLQQACLCSTIRIADERGNINSINIPDKKKNLYK